MDRDEGLHQSGRVWNSSVFDCDEGLVIWELSELWTSESEESSLAFIYS